MKSMDNCSHDKLVLFPDYSSSGLWCNECGIGFGDPSKDFPSIPKGLLALAEVWNEYWDYLSSSSGLVNTDYVQRLVDLSGQEIAKLINVYIPCVFDIHKSEIDKR